MPDYNKKRYKNGENNVYNILFHKKRPKKGNTMQPLLSLKIHIWSTQPPPKIHPEG